MRLLGKNACSRGSLLVPLGMLLALASPLAAQPFGPPGQQFGPPPVGGAASYPPPQPGFNGGAQNFEGAEIIARVDKHVILANEVLGAVDVIMEENRDRIPPEQWETQRWLLARQFLKGIVESKLVYADAVNSIPAENLPKIRERVDEQFEKTQVQSLLERAKSETRAELEEKLIAQGSSLALQKQSFFEKAIASQWLREQVKVDENISHADKLAYYETHTAEFEHPAFIRWEQLTAELPRYATPEARMETHDRLVAMGNEVIVRRAPLSEVAKAASDGPNARTGGLHEVTLDSDVLYSEQFTAAILGLPIGQMSRIIEDDNAFHIVRVLERTPARRTPFRDAQIEIKEKIIAQRRKKALDEYYDVLRDKIRIWTIFDDPAFARRMNLPAPQQ